MKMDSLRVAIIFLASITATPVLAQSQPPASPPETAAQLDQLMAPIALYPDELVGDILMRWIMTTSGPRPWRVTRNATSPT
jgi:hypothetical protein